MDYAVVLYFDKESETKMQAMIDKVAEETGCDYMKRVGIPPHVTVSALISEDENLLLDEMGRIAGVMKSGDVCFASIGVFNPLVIFLAPVMNEYLQSTCKMVNESLLRYAKAGNKGNYLPNQWVPHAALAVKLSPEALKVAFEVVQSEFQAFGGKADRIVLAKCNPYKELKVWKLSDLDR